MNSSEQVMMLVLWVWIGFTATFTAVVWARLASLPPEWLFGRPGSSFALPIVRILVSALGVAGVLSTIRLWATRMVDPYELSIAALWFGAALALALTYWMRYYLFKGPAENERSR